MFLSRSRFRSCRIPHLVALLCLALAMPAWAAPPTSLSLDDGWQVRLVPGQAQAKEHPQATVWLPAQIPGTVQTDLMAAGLVPDPFLGSNEGTIQWVGLSDWQYRGHFNVDAATLKRERVELVFDGLDTLAEVRLNGKPLLDADNIDRKSVV